MKERQRFLYREERAFDVDGERLLEVFLGDCAKRGSFATAGVRKHDIEASCLRPHRVIETV